MIRNYQHKGNGPSVDVSGIYNSINQMQIQINELYTRTIIPSSNIEIPSSLTVQFVRLSNSITNVQSSIYNLETYQNSLRWDMQSIRQSTDVLSTDMLSMSQYMASLGQSINDLSMNMTNGSNIDIPTSITQQIISLSNALNSATLSIYNNETYAQSLGSDISILNQSTDALSTSITSMSQYVSSLAQSINDLSTKMTGGGGGGGTGESSTVPTLYNITTPGTYTNPISYQKSMFDGHMTYMISNISAPTMYFEDIYFYGPGGYSFSALSADKVFADGMIRLFYNCSFKTLSMPNDSHFAINMESCTINDLYWTRVSINDTEWTNMEAWINSCSFDNISLHIDCSALAFDGAMLILDNCTVANDMTVYIPQTTRTTNFMYIGVGLQGGKYYPELIKNWTVYNANIGLNNISAYGELRFNEPLRALGLYHGVFGGVTATMDEGGFQNITCGDMSINVTPRNTELIQFVSCNAANAYVSTPKQFRFSDNTFNNLNFTASNILSPWTAEYNTVTGYLRGMLTETISYLSFYCPYKMITLLSTLA
jgi:prefoldin subunit 5